MRFVESCGSIVVPVGASRCEIRVVYAHEKPVPLSNLHGRCALEESEQAVRRPIRMGEEHRVEQPHRQAPRLFFFDTAPLQLDVQAGVPGVAGGGQPAEEIVQTLAHHGSAAAVHDVRDQRSITPRLLQRTIHGGSPG